MGNEISQTPDRRRLHERAVLVGLIAVVAGVVLAAHWPVLSCEALSWDDEQYLLENQLVQNPSLGSARRFLGEVLYPSTVRGYYQPLAMISLMLDYAAGGRVDNLMPFRRTSLLLHVANSVLLVVLLYLLFGDVLVAGMVGVVYGVHPLTIESIPWLAERKTLLAAFFCLWCLIFYVRFCRSANIKSYLVSILFFVLALMSKPTSTPVPLLMLVLDYWPLKRLSKKAIVEKIPFVIIAGISAIVTFVSQRNTAHVIMPSQQGYLQIPLTICHNIVFYLYKFIWPVRLSAFYPFPSPFTLEHPMVLAGVIGTGVLILLLLLSLRWTRALLAGWLFFFLAVFPTLGIVGFHPVIAADRHVYLPMLGFLLPVAAFLCWFRRGSRRSFGRRAAIALAAVLLVGGAEIAAGRHYLVYWRDTVAHYEYMLSLSPDCPILHNNLALALENADQIDKAVEHYRKSLELKPNSPEVHNNLGNALSDLGETDAAIKHYREALRLKPKFAAAHYNLALALAKKTRYEESIAEYRRAVQIKPDYTEAWANLGSVLVEAGQVEQAVECYEQALGLEPDFIVAHGRLALVLARLGRIDGAIEHCRIVLEARPDDHEMHFNLGYLLELKGELDEAIDHYRKAVEISPDYTQARQRLQAALARQKTQPTTDPGR